MIEALRNIKKSDLCKRSFILHIIVGISFVVKLSVNILTLTNY